MSRVKIIAKLKKIKELRGQIEDLQAQCFHNAVILKSGSNTGNWDGYDVANVANRIMLEVKPNIKNVGDNPLQVIYNNNLPGMLKDVVYYTSVYGIPMNCALDMNIIYKACKQLDEHGWLEK